MTRTSVPTPIRPSVIDAISLDAQALADMLSDTAPSSSVSTDVAALALTFVDTVTEHAYGAALALAQSNLDAATHLGAKVYAARATKDIATIKASAARDAASAATMALALADFGLRVVPALAPVQAPIAIVAPSSAPAPVKATSGRVTYTRHDASARLTFENDGSSLPYSLICDVQNIAKRCKSMESAYHVVYGHKVADRSLRGIGARNVTPSEAVTYWGKGKAL